jgi:hypothetical protein
MVIRVSEALVAGSVMVRPAWEDFGETISGLVERLVASGQIGRASCRERVSLEV